MTGVQTCALPICEEGDEIMFINPEELLLQKSEVDAPERAYRVHVKWQELHNLKGELID